MFRLFPVSSSSSRCTHRKYPDAIFHVKEQCSVARYFDGISSSSVRVSDSERANGAAPAQHCWTCVQTISPGRKKKMYNIFRFFSFSHLFPEGVVVGYKREERCSTVKPPAERFFSSSNGRLMQMMGALIILRLLLTLFSFFLSSSSFQTQFSSCVFLSSWRNIREKSWCVISNRCWHGRNSGRESDANFSPSNRFVWVSFM